MTEERTFTNELRSVTDARRYVLGGLGDVAPDVSESVAVMISELAANAVRHTASDFTVTVDRGPSELRVAVTDSGPGSPTVRTPQRTEPSGRGLQLVNALAAAWGVIPSSTATGKTVWFTIALQPSVDEAVTTREIARPYEGYASESEPALQSAALDEIDGEGFGENASPRAHARELLLV
jgi:anti-sigma regulatory factor (Ser/Thr protein kinase)